MFKVVVFLGVLAGSGVTSVSLNHQDAGAVEQDADAVQWVEAMRVEITKSRRVRNLNSGAPGTGAFAFRVGRYGAGALIDRLDRKGIAVFVGMSYPPEVERTALKDVRAEFLVGDGGDARWVHVSAGAHACAAAAVYRPPSDVPETELRAFRMLYDPKAGWME